MARAIVLAMVLLLFASPASAARLSQQQRQNLAIAKCKFAYALIHADGTATDDERRWLSSLDCWEDGYPITVAGP